MNLLLDTHVLLWWLQDSRKLGKRSRKAILHPGAATFISSVSVWEVSIKLGSNQMKVREPLGESISFLLDHGFQSLPVTIDHALAVKALPDFHRDPFDRMLVTQAQCEDLTILTADSAIEAYDVRTMNASE